MTDAASVDRKYATSGIWTGGRNGDGFSMIRQTAFLENVHFFQKWTAVDFAQKQSHQKLRFHALKTQIPCT